MRRDILSLFLPQMRGAPQRLMLGFVSPQTFCWAYPFKIGLKPTGFLVTSVID